MMNDFISIFILLTEILMVLQCLQIVFKKDLRFDKYMFGIVVINIVVYLGINFKYLPMFSSILIYVVLYVYCYYQFKLNHKKTIVGYIIGLTLASCIEVITACVTNLVESVQGSIYALFMSSVLALIIAYVIKKKITLIDFGKVKNISCSILGLVLFYGLALGSLIIDYYMNKSLIKLYAVFILLFIVFIFFYLYRLEQARHEIERKNYELELQKIYRGTYEKLLFEIRRKQHDYKNQLGAINSMHLVATSLEELVNMQKEYEESVQEDCKFDSILINCNNSVLAGYIYHRCVSCEKEGITVDYNIHIDMAECSFALHEIIEILGILIDNACECITARESENKAIKLEFHENEDRIMLLVSNPTEYIDCSTIEKMFAPGYSTKGEDRGIGLSRVYELVNEYNAIIKVFNSEYDNQNWINFVLEILK